MPAPDWLRQIPQCGWGQQVEKETGGAASQEKHRRESEREREGRVIMCHQAVTVTETATPELRDNFPHASHQ